MFTETKQEARAYHADGGAKYGKKYKKQKKEPWEEIFGPRHAFFDQLKTCEKTTPSKSSEVQQLGQISGSTGVDHKQRKYFKDVHWRLKTGFRDDAAKATYAKEVLGESASQALILACDGTISRLLLRVIPMAEPEDLVQFMQSLILDLQLACTHQLCSHVTLTVLKRVQETYPKLVQAELNVKSKEGDDKVLSNSSNVKKSLEEWILSLATYLLENFETLVKDWSASHLCRVMFQVLSGCSITDNVGGTRNLRRIASWISSSKAAKENVERIGDVPQQFTDTFEQFYNKVVSLQNISDLIFVEEAVPVLVALLLLVNEVNRKWMKGLVLVLLSIFELEPNSLLDMTDILTSEVGTYVLQKALLLCKDKQFSKMWRRYFRGKLEGLALHPVGCMMVQHLLDACRTQEQLQEMCSELCPMMEAILDATRHNVMSSLAGACARLQICQDEYVKAIETAFHIGSADRVMLVPLLTSQLHQELFWLCHEYKGDRTGEYTKSLNGKKVKGKLEIQLHGALTLQHMAAFTRTKKLMKSLLGLDQKMLKEIACHGYGHDFFTACYSSTTVPLKMKQRLTAHMQGKFCTLACDMLGSRVLESMWSMASVKQRATLVKELSQQEGALKANFHGFNIQRRFSMVEFSKQRGKWMKNQEKDAQHDAIRASDQDDDQPKKKKPKTDKEDSEEEEDDDDDSE